MDSQRPPDAAPPAAAEQELLASLQHILIGGRWALFLAEASVAALQFPRIERRLPADEALGAMALYNVAALLAVYRFAPRKVPAALFLAADVATVGVLTAFTGGISSPFAGLFFLIILSGAIYYDLAGGLILAGVASAIILGSSALAPRIWADLLHGEARTQMIPYLLLTGGFAGYLVRQLKRLHERRVEVEQRLRRTEYDEELRRREAAVAREVQRATLVPPPHHPRFQIAVRFEPARAVGGDFYAFATAGAKLGVILGDVSGKGTPAALTSTSIAYLIHSLQPLEDPEGCLATLNTSLLEQSLTESFASMVFALLDPEAERLVVYNAGHPPALILSGDTVQRVRQPNLPLGMFPQVRFMPEAFSFGPGATLVLYSDAFIEARSAAGEELTVEGLEAIVRRHAGLPTEEMANWLIEETRAFGTVTDDLTLVVVRLRPETHLEPYRLPDGHAAASPETGQRRGVVA